MDTIEARPLKNISKGFNGESKDETLVKKTRTRRIQAIREHNGAVQLAHGQKAAGGRVHWEWPSGCGGRAHHVIREMGDEFDMTAVKAAGCAMGAKTPMGEIAKKERLIATTSPRTAARPEPERSGGHAC